MKDGKHVILHVDDDPDMIETMKLIIEGNGYIFESASSAEEGLKMYKTVSPDLIIVDLMMEEVDAGTHMVKELKLSGNTAPIFMLSSVGDQLHMTADHSALGLSGIFQKPIQSETIVKTLKAKLG